MMNYNNISTISDLRFKTKKVLKKAHTEPLFLFHRSSPKGVLLSFEIYQEIMNLLEDYFDSLKAEEYEKEDKNKIKWASFNKFEKLLNV